MQVDILAFGAHPDDVELSCSGTILSHIQRGGTAGIVDLTQGELGSRGNAETRQEEAKRAAGILGVSFRENLGLPDGFFRSDKESLLKVVKMIRRYRPKVVLANAVRDRHPDHGRGAGLIAEACFLSGLIKIITEDGGEQQAAWRPGAVYHYVQDYYVKPDLVVDISHVWERKLDSIRAFSTQFYSGEDDEGPKTPISSKAFLDFIEARAREWGRPAGVDYAEAYSTERVIGVRSLLDVF